MSRLFEDAGLKGKRRWQCFVCGKQHTDYDSYKEHILVEHEKGREFISCPACDAPVRDLKSHFRIKHPNRIMPGGVQTRVAIWRDFSPSGDKKKTKKPSFHQGTYYSRKNNGVEVRYRSGLERDFYEALEADVDVASYQAEPFKIPYFYNGEWHNYIPDLRINYIDGSTEIWELKPANQTDTTVYEQNGAKWAAMNDHATNMGWRFVVQNEVGLGKIKAKIRRRRLDEETNSPGH